MFKCLPKVRDVAKIIESVIPRKNRLIITTENELQNVTRRETIQLNADATNVDNRRPNLKINYFNPLSSRLFFNDS